MMTRKIGGNRDVVQIFVIEYEMEYLSLRIFGRCETLFTHICSAMDDNFTVLFTQDKTFKYNYTYQSVVDYALNLIPVNIN